MSARGAMTRQRPTGHSETVGGVCAFAHTLAHAIYGRGSHGTTCPRRWPRDFLTVLPVVQGRFSQQRLSLQVGGIIGTYTAFGLGKGPFVAPRGPHDASTYKWRTPGHIEVLAGKACTTRSTVYYDLVHVLGQ